jgi:hypothetical protein
MEYNGVSMIGGNCKKSPMNITLIFEMVKGLILIFVI